MRKLEDASLQTDALFISLGSEVEQTLDQIVGLMDDFGHPHPALLKRRMLFELLYLSMRDDGTNPLIEVFRTTDPRGCLTKVRFFKGFLGLATKRGMDDIDELLDLLHELNRSLYTYMYR